MSGTKEASNAAPPATFVWAPPLHRRARMGNLLWLIIVILFIAWLAGFFFKLAGGLIHILLVIAVILVIVRLVTGRRVV